MADEQQTQVEADTPAEALVDVAETADRLAEIASQSLDTTEVARQIEELTSVVLDSAEVSTRSASIAAGPQAIVDRVARHARCGWRAWRTLLVALDLTEYRRLRGPVQILENDAAQRVTGGSTINDVAAAADRG